MTDAHQTEETGSPSTPGETARRGNLLRRLGGAFTMAISLMNSAGTLWVFGLMFLVCADVVGRTVFSNPLPGVIELLGYSIVGAVYLQLAHTLHSNRFTMADILINVIDRRYPMAGQVYHLLFSIFGIFVFLLIAYGTLDLLQRAWPNEVMGVRGVFTIQTWPLRTIVFAGSVAVALVYLVRLMRSGADLAASVRARRSQTAEHTSPVGWHCMVLPVIVIIAAAALFGFDLSRVQIGLISFALMLALICLGMHIAVALITLGFFGIWLMGLPHVGVNSVKLAANEFLNSDIFGTVPLFVLMGFLVNESDIGKDTFLAARWALRRVKGGIGIATVAANAVFASITGSSIASAAVFTKIATPQMINQGYTPRFAVGTVAGSSVLGVLIPPSLLLIIYGFISEQSVGILFLAAVIPGLLLTVAMAASIIGMAHFMPNFAGTPNHDDVADVTALSALHMLAPIIVLVTAVLGGIYLGWFTPVEAGAVGAALALILALMRRRLTLASLWKVLLETGHVTVSVLFLILAARIYSQMLALSGLPQNLGDMILAAELGYAGFMMFFIIVLIVLGMFLDSVSIMLVVLPLVLPIANAMGIDLIALGIITVIGLEMGLLTPPMGLCVYIVKTTLDDDRVSLVDIFAGAFPFVLTMFCVLVLLVAFPWIANMDPFGAFRLAIESVTAAFAP